MPRQKIQNMSFTKVYEMLLQKAEKKKRSREEVYEITSWLTGYTEQELIKRMNSDLTYGEFFEQAPKMNKKAEQIKGVICGVRVEEIKDPLMREIRILDKLIDELAKGKPIDRILPK